MSSVDVRSVSTTNVRPASYTDEQASDTYKRIDLNPMDLLFLNDAYMQRGFLFTKQHEEGTNDECINDKISHLTTSLSRTLDHFFPLAGRLGIEKYEDGKMISVYIDCNFKGAEFVHATTDISVEDILSPTYIPHTIIDRLFLLNGVRISQGQSQPLLSIQVTELTDGVFIGCSVNHCVCDGTSFWQFIISWSEVTSSSYYHAYLCPPPVFERWFIKETGCPIQRCFRFTKPNITALKEKASLEIISETKQNTVISSLQAILAFVWTAVIRSKISTGIVTLKEGELIKRPGFGFLASMLNKAIKSNNYEKSRSFTESWIEKHLMSSPGGYTGIIGNIFLARSSQWFNMYGNNFGWGRPV
ncbi:hypothetical protein MKX03_021764 [Papaver bracteatum]|nr:hypothetical protein MKX03_021764 [Papaver bracteatum]